MNDAPQLEDFRKWLISFDTRDIVGFAWSLSDCPLQRWARTTNHGTWPSWANRYGVAWGPIIARLVDCFPPETPMTSGTVVELVGAVQDAVNFYAPTLTNKES